MSSISVTCYLLVAVTHRHYLSAVYLTYRLAGQVIQTLRIPSAEEQHSSDNGSCTPILIIGLLPDVFFFVVVVYIHAVKDASGSHA